MSFLSRSRLILSRFSSTSFSSLKTCTHSRINTFTPFSFQQSVRSFASHGEEVHENEFVPLAGRQYEVALLGNFPDSPSSQPFGTMTHPSLIYSGKHSRIVGCIGGGVYTHRLQWFELKEGKKHVCHHCGQVFKLVTDHNFHEVRDIVDQRTRDHFDYYKTLTVKEGQQPPAADTQVGPHSRY